jgi:DNA-binding transcriptional MerR regulator
MLKIGEFSRLSQVTVKTLRYYDDIGLIKPAQIDPFTNHRYYNLEQLPRIHRIMALKGLGLSLEEIQLMLNKQVEVDQVQPMLRQKKAELTRRLLEDQARLAQVEFHLRMIEAEAAVPDLEVVVKEIPELTALTLRTSISKNQLVPMGKVFEKALLASQITLAGPATEIRYAETYEPEFEDVEFVLPVARETADIPIPDFGVLSFKKVPALKTAATVIHHGAHSQSFEEALVFLQRWVVANGYRLGGSNRAVHLRGPFDHAEYADWITEIQHEITTVK